MNMIDRIGVNTHLDFAYTGSPYLDVPKVIAAIKYLGVKHLRDCAGGPESYKIWVAVRNATGAKFCAYLPEGSQTSVHTAFTYWPLLYRNGLIDMFEGPNEDDDPYAIANGNNLAAAVRFTQDVAAPYVHPLGKPLVNVSVGSGWTATDGWKGDYDAIPDMTAYCSHANAHVYPNSDQDVVTTTQRIGDLARMSMPGKPLMVTELGWDLNHAGQSADKVAADIVKISGTSIAERIYIYALFDDQSGRFGLFDDDGTPRPGAVAVQGLLAA